MNEIAIPATHRQWTLHLERHDGSKTTARITFRTPGTEEHALLHGAAYVRDYSRWINALTGVTPT